MKLKEPLLDELPTNFETGSLKRAIAEVGPKLEAATFDQITAELANLLICWPQVTDGEVTAWVETIMERKLSPEVVARACKEVRANYPYPTAPKPAVLMEYVRKDVEYKRQVKTLAWLQIVLSRVEQRDRDEATREQRVAEKLAKLKANAERIKAMTAAAEASRARRGEKNLEPEKESPQTAAEKRQAQEDFERRKRELLRQAEDMGL